MFFFCKQFNIWVLIIVVNIILKLILLHCYHNYTILLVMIYVINLYKFREHARE